MGGTKAKEIRRSIRLPKGTPWKRMFRLDNGMIINDGVQGKLRKVKKAYNKLPRTERG